MTTVTTTPTFKDRALRAVAILGLIAILVLGAWGIIQIAFSLYGLLGAGNDNTPAHTSVQVQQEQLVVTAPPAVTSGSPFNLSFAHQNATGNYAYEISYSCAQGLSVEAPLPTGKLQTVPCNTPFNYTNATVNAPLTAVITGSTQVGTTFTVGARNLATGLVTSSGITQTTVVPAPSKTTVKPAATKPASTATTKPASTYVAASRTSNLYGTSDLSVSMGTVSGSNGRYSAQFTIQNVGTNVTPANWTFNASLPASPVYTYTSAAQQALYPGDKIVYTLSFALQNYGTNASYSGYSYGNYNSTYPSYSNCAYTNNYTYNGTYSYPGTSYNCNNNSTYNYPTYYNRTANNSYQYGGYANYMTVTVDPSNYVQESSEVNNSTSATLPY